jgi:GNAT superfamily N-acetyltransferase
VSAVPIDASSALERAFAFEHECARRAAGSVVPVTGGFAVLHPDFPNSTEHNRLVVTEATEAMQVLEDAERILGDAGIGYRQIDVDDDTVGEGFGPAFEAAGFNHSTQLLMAFTAEPDREADVPVEQVTFRDVRERIAEAWRRRFRSSDDEGIRQLVDRQVTRERASTVSYFAVRRESQLVSRCELYQRGSVAQVDAVMTDPGWQGQGFARAAVLHAARSAIAQGCTLVFLRTDSDDWPQHLYRRLGFTVFGRAHGFQRALDTG